ncbi:zinc finger protein Xfin-like [Fopius arisanus]|uniref:ZNF91 protein n=1 Tax=Fopius arisanus TaxID=64838 RepID=A0A0C9QIJ1_9HYME|nr:PREDICTED: zinc finger protein Xfin-like [Fopius arisanus]XP_011314233.1 PREDICTED: zinc finger protein Xfin-like [Fopius arisanus]
MESRERYEQLCRLCASYDAVKMDIFGQEGKNRQLVDKIQTCLPFKIAEDDRLPKCLCYRCMYNLENFYDFRTACVNAVAVLERSLPPSESKNGDERDVTEQHSELRSELLKEKEKMPILIPEAPIVNPNAALGTPPRLNSDGEADPEIEEVMNQSGTDEGMDDTEDRKSDEYEMDMETNPSDFLEMPPMVTDDAEDPQNQHVPPVPFQHTSEQHEVYVCSLCNKAFSSKGHLSLHARIHVGAGDVIGEKVITDDHTSYKRPYQCDLCNKSYSTAKHRWGHVSTTHRGHPAVTCRYCSRIYSTRTNLEEHIKSRHTGLPPPPEMPVPYVQQDTRYQCKTCPKMYTNVTDLNKHSRVCLGDRQSESSRLPQPKGRCLMDTSDMSSLESDEESKDYRNAEAKLSKNPQLTILKQALTRTDDKREEQISPYKSLKSKNDTNHEKKWYCEFCPLNFTSTDALKDHETVHDSDKPYICILCEKDFVLKSSLSRHIVASHGVDPVPIIESDRCLKKNVLAKSRVGELKHETSASPYSPEPRIDNDDDDPESRDDNMIEIETVFVCEICTRDFNDRASLWLHIRATHKEFAAFACGVCLKICSDNEQLLSHVNMYHGGSKLLVSEQRRYSCTICGRQHDSRKKLMTHVSIHNIDSTYDPASFVQLNSNYYNDSLNNEQEGDFDAEDGEKVNCYVCKKSFPNEDHLIRHQRNAHKSDQTEPSANGGINPNGNKAQYHLFFVCELCGSSHPSKWERWLHVNSVHSDETTIRCERSDCGKIFATKSLRNEHQQHHMMQGSSPNTCEICGKLWGSRVDYWKHVMGVHADTVPLICGVCLKVFPDVGQLSCHVKSNHWPLTNGDFSCDICGRPYSNKSKMSRHRKIHGLDNEGINNGINDSMNDTINSEHSPLEVDLSCEMCAELSFASWEDLCNHRRLIHALFPCDLCNKCYGRTSHLWKHVNRVHKGHKDVTCPYCMKTSASKDHLAAHIAKIHRYEPETKESKDSGNYASQSAEEDVIHHCEKCNKGFHKRYLLRRHMKGCQNYRKDPGALLTRCRACERIFKDRASLQKHIENHHSSYTCHLCDETITSKLGIMTHNRINHMDHPDLTCSNCKKLFRTREDLESHKKDHKYHNSPNVCDFCGDTVENKLKLKMHILSLHRNEIGVSCGVCLIPMKDPKDLKKHVEDVHGSILRKPNTCQVCGKQYASKWKAFDHTKKCHGKVFRTCKQCLAVFTTDSDIKYHYEHVHNVPKDQLSGFENHVEPVNKSKESVAVKEEPEDVDDEDNYDEGPRVTEKRKRTDTFDCEICPEIFLNDETLAEHYRIVHNSDPERMLKKMKFSAKKKMRARENFECNNCTKQFSTKTLYWNHIDTCTRRSSKDDSRPGSTSILETHLKNNNQIKKEPQDAEMNESDLNIPDFNLFEDINLQLSAQKPIPNLMPLSQMKMAQNLKCYRKDSRKVYDESTNTVCACEVCGKQWPAKKHLWQHLIRFHRAEAAVTCGVCLKLCTTYKDLSQHLKDAHEAILSCEGNNFTCKTCGRYHNARSKLLLHMSIHINNNEHVWCSKCATSFETQDKLDQHVDQCLVKRREAESEDHSNDNDEDMMKHENEEDKGSLIGDGASLMEEVEEDVDFDSEQDASENGENSEHSEDSEGSDSGNEEENEIESRANSRVTGDVSQSDEEDGDSDVPGGVSEMADEGEISVKDEESRTEAPSVPERDEQGEEKPPESLKSRGKKLGKSAEDSDDEGPPILSPMVPLPSENEEDPSGDREGESSERMSNEGSVRKGDGEEGEEGEEGDIPELDGIEEEGEKEPLSPHSNDYDDYSSTAKSASAVASAEEDSNDEMDDDDSRLQIDHEDSQSKGSEEVADEEADGVEEGGEVQIEGLDGTVLVVANDAQGNQILIRRSIEEMAEEDEEDESIGDVAGFIYQEENENENEDEVVGEDENTHEQANGEEVVDGDGDDGEEEAEEEGEGEGEGEGYSNELDNEVEDVEDMEVEESDDTDDNSSAKNNVSRT